MCGLISMVDRFFSPFFSLSISYLCLTPTPSARPAGSERAWTATAGGYGKGGGWRRMSVRVCPPSPGVFRRQRFHVPSAPVPAHSAPRRAAARDGGPRRVRRVFGVARSAHPRWRGLSFRSSRRPPPASLPPPCSVTHTRPTPAIGAARRARSLSAFLRHTSSPSAAAAAGGTSSGVPHAARMPHAWSWGGRVKGRGKGKARGEDEHRRVREWEKNTLRFLSPSFFASLVFFVIPPSRHDVRHITNRPTAGSLA